MCPNLQLLETSLLRQFLDLIDRIGSADGQWTVNMDDGRPTQQAATDPGQPISKVCSTQIINQDDLCRGTRHPLQDSHGIAFGEVMQEQCTHHNIILFRQIARENVMLKESRLSDLQAARQSSRMFDRGRTEVAAADFQWQAAIGCQPCHAECHISAARGHIEQSQWSGTVRCPEWAKLLEQDMSRPRELIHPFQSAESLLMSRRLQTRLVH